MGQIDHAYYRTWHSLSDDVTKICNLFIWVKVLRCFLNSMLISVIKMSLSFSNYCWEIIQGVPGGMDKTSGECSLS